MKNTILLSSLTFLGLFTLMITITIYGRLDRKMELESNLSSAVEACLEDIVKSDFYDSVNMDECMEDMARKLVLSIDMPLDITIDVLQYDAQKGIVSVRVELSYMHPNGKTGTVVSERHAIWNQLIEKEGDEKGE